MSNIGKQPINLPDGIEVEVNNNNISIKGKLGKLSLTYSNIIKIEKIENAICITRKSDDRNEKSLHGLYRALVNNMVIGVTEGYSKELQLNGVGYTAELKNNFLLVNAGYSHPIYFQIPEGITIETPNITTIIIKGINYQITV